MSKKEKIFIESFVGEGACFKGLIKTKGIVHIQGELEGEIDSESTVIVGVNGMVKAEIKAKDVQNSGQVEGKALVSGKITLFQKSRFSGEIKAAKLTIKEGAFFDGKKTRLNHKS